jgi:hypothetical protein
VAVERRELPWNRHLAQDPVWGRTATVRSGVPVDRQIIQLLYVVAFLCVLS